MKTSPTERGKSLWSHLVQSHRAFIAARMNMLSERDGLVDLVRAGLDDPAERVTALEMVPYLPEEAQKELFPDVLALSSYAHGLTDTAIDIVTSLPRAWVLENVEAHAERLLAGGYEEYRMLLRVYERLAPALARKLAERAARDPDADIREAGEDFLERQRV